MMNLSVFECSMLTLNFKELLCVGCLKNYSHTHKKTTEFSHFFFNFVLKFLINSDSNCSLLEITHCLKRKISLVVWPNEAHLSVLNVPGLRSRKKKNVSFSFSLRSFLSEWKKIWVHDRCRIKFYKSKE